MCEISATRGTLKAVWEDIGEGWSGEYNPDDPDDTPLLRFSVYDGEEQMEDASYCTQMPVSTDEAILRRALVRVLDAAESSSRKREFERLSWMKPSDFPS